MWIAGVLIIFIVLVSVDYKQLRKKKKKSLLVVYSTFMLAAFLLTVIVHLHILPVEWFSPIQLITIIVQTLFPFVNQS